MNKLFLSVALLALFSLSFAQTSSGFLPNDDQSVSFAESFQLLIDENGEGEWVGESGEGEGEWNGEGSEGETGEGEGEWIGEGENEWTGEGEGEFVSEEGWLAEEWINIEGLGQELVIVDLDPIGWLPENEPSQV